MPQPKDPSYCMTMHYVPVDCNVCVCLTVCFGLQAETPTCTVYEFNKLGWTVDFGRGAEVYILRYIKNVASFKASAPQSLCHDHSFYPCGLASHKLHPSGQCACVIFQPCTLILGPKYMHLVLPAFTS